MSCYSKIRIHYQLGHLNGYTSSFKHSSLLFICLFVYLFYLLLLSRQHSVLVSRLRKKKIVAITNIVTMKLGPIYKFSGFH